MAKIGMKYAVYAPFSGTHTSGTAITYGTGKKLCHAISADVTINRRDNPLYGDDTKIENDKGNPSLNTLNTLARAIGVEVSIFSRSDTKLVPLGKSTSSMR